MIRRATLADAPAIAHLQIDGWQHTYRGILPDTHLDTMDPTTHTRQWATWMSTGTHVHLATHNHQPIGFSAAGPAHTDAPPGHDAEIYALYIHHHAQRQGHGRALFHASRQATGNRTLVIWTLTQNPHRRFYERLGGRLIATKKTEIGGVEVEEVAYGWDAVT